MQFYIAILKKDVIKRLTDSASGLSQLIQSITGFFTLMIALKPT